MLTIPQLQKPYRGATLNRTHSLAKGIVGYWLMNEGTGNAIYDLSGYGSHGAFSNNPGAFTWPSQGLKFAAISSVQVISCGTNEIFNFGGDFSIATKLKSNNTALGTVCTRSNGGVGLQTPELGYAIIVRRTGGTDRIFFNVSGDVDFFITSYNTNTILNDKFYSIACVRSGNDFIIYLDGVEVLNVNVAIGDPTVSGRTFKIGNDETGGDRFLGDVDFISVYDRALSPEEVVSLHREPYAMFAKPQYFSIGGETRSFAGAVIGQSSVATAELNLTTQITGNQIIAQSTISADLILTTQITGNTVVGQSVISGNVTIVGGGETQNLAGNIVGQSVVTGELQQTISIGGNVDAQSTVSGTLQQTVALGGSVSGQSTVSGNVLATRGLAGNVDAQSTVVGDLILTVALGGGVDGQSDVSGELQQTVILSGSIDAVSTVSGNLSGPEETHQFAGTITAVSVVSGNITVSSLSAISSLKKEIWDMLVEDSTYIGLVGSPSAVPYQTFYLRNPIQPIFPEVVFSLAPGRVNKNLAPEFLSTEYELKFRIRTRDGGYESIGDRIIQLLQHKPNADLGFRSVVSQSKELVDHELRIFGKDLVFKVFYRRVT